MPLTLQPVGALVDAHPARRPERVTLSGRAVTLAPLDADKHADALFASANGGDKDRLWTYLFDGPYTDAAVFKASLAVKARSADPLSFAILDNASGLAVGHQSLMRVDATHRVIEVGDILYTPAIQRTIGAHRGAVSLRPIRLRRPRLSPLRVEVQ